MCPLCVSGVVCIGNDKALHLSVEQANERNQVRCVAGIACVIGGREAARLWGAVEAHELSLGFRMLGYERRRYERHIEAMRDQLREPVFSEACTEGRRLALAEAVRDALNVPNSSGRA